jgi:hypothetical protein
MDFSKFQYIKKYVNNLIYKAIESSALVERLLNDYLKATEAFNKLKKMNDELKQQVGSESKYVSVNKK